MNHEQPGDMKTVDVFYSVNIFCISWDFRKPIIFKWYFILLRYYYCRISLHSYHLLFLISHKFNYL